jgi:signal transduction histidine kinase
VEKDKYLLLHGDLFELLLLYIPMIILVVNAQGDILLANKKFYEIFQTSEDEAIGHSLNKFIPLKEITVPTVNINKSEGSAIETEHNINVGNAESTVIITTITLKSDEYLIIGRDVTIERQEQEKLYFNDRLASIGEMAAGIAHELNNPLTGIVMLSQSLGQSELPEAIKKDISDINCEASRAIDVVRNLLAFARKQSPAKRLTQINKIINDVIRLRHYEQTVNNINTVMMLDPDLPEIMVDNVQIQQVFLNLVLNAEYAMVQTHHKGQLEIETSTSRGKVIVSFTDDGEGIKEADIRRIFQPFYTTKEVGVGTGLGLSLSYGIISRHGGTISVHSKYGAGAAFVVELPIDISQNTKDEI